MDIEDPQQLVAYLRREGYLGKQEWAHIAVLEGGVSNRTVLVEWQGETWVLKQALDKLRVAADWYADPRRIHREALGLRWLAELTPAGSVPELIFEDERYHILAMSAVPQPHQNWKAMLLKGEVRAAHVTQFARLLGTIHRESYLRQATLGPIFDDRSYFEALRLEPYFEYTAQQVPAAARFLLNLVEATRAHRLCVVHGDFSPKNILVHADRLVLLDHEVIHFGDPAFDLGFALTHLLSKAHHVRAYREAFQEAVLLFWEVYLETIGAQQWLGDLEDRAVANTLGCLLARAAGRSPLEYLDGAERDRQQRAVVKLMASPPAHLPELITQFVQEVGHEN